MLQYQYFNNNNLQNDIQNSNNNFNINQFHNTQYNSQQEVNGGVSVTLDYDIKVMSDFILKSSLIAFNIPSSSSASSFSSTQLNEIIAQINAVLNATRLPKVTIFQSLDYLFKYLENTAASYRNETVALHAIYEHIMVSFILANKFNDDKTFTNKSWAQATSIPLLTLNQWERNWLQILNYNLFNDKFIAYDDFVFSYEIFIQETVASLQPSLQPSLPSSSSPISSIQSPIIKDTDFTNRQGGFNYDYYIFGQNNSNSNTAPQQNDILLTPMPMAPQQFVPISLPLPLPLSLPLPLPQQQQQQYPYDPSMYYYPQTNRWNNSDLMNFHVSSINNINYNTVY